MLIETLSVFPQCFDSVMNESIMKRAQEKGVLEFRTHNLRDWTHDKHRTTIWWRARLGYEMRTNL
jgi:tRNA (guanine37-N1)-methyltransferase